MRMKCFAVLALLGVASLVAGCGGGSGDSGYVNPADHYEKSISGRSSAPAAPAAGAGNESVGERTGDETGGGNYGERKFEGVSQADLGGQLSEAEYREAEQACKDSAKAHKMYMEYMAKKRDSGQRDEGLLNSTIGLLDQILPKLTDLGEKYSDNIMIQEALKNAIEDHRALMYEK